MSYCSFHIVAQSQHEPKATLKSPFGLCPTFYKMILISALLMILYVCTEYLYIQKTGSLVA